MKRLAQSRIFRWCFLIALLLTGAVIGGLTALPPRKQPEFVVFRQPYQFPVPWRDRIGRLIPATPSWSWVWRLDQWVFGMRKTVNIFSEVLVFAHSSSQTVSSLALGVSSFTDPNGIQVWLLRTEELKALRQRFKQTPGIDVLHHPRMSTADDVCTEMFVGESIPLHGSTNDVGLKMGCLARVHPDSTDLTASIRFSELVCNAPAGAGGSSFAGILLIQTNLDAAFRVQIPKGSGLFLLDGLAAGSNRKRIGLIIDPP